MKFLDKTFEVFGWIKIMGSMLLSGVILGAIVYAFMTNIAGLVIGISIAISFLVLGIVWATRVWKKQGTTSYLGDIRRTNELDARGVLKGKYDSEEK